MLESYCTGCNQSNPAEDEDFYSECCNEPVGTRQSKA